MHEGRLRRLRALVDWKIEKGGDSGIYLRGSPQVQIWDPEANPVGSGGLFNNQKGPSRPSEKADRPVGEWNTFRVFMMGERVTVYLNDRRVVDNVGPGELLGEGQADLLRRPDRPQDHGNPLWFRNVFVREIPRDTAVPAMSDVEASEGFSPLFNGRDLEGWTATSPDTPRGRPDRRPSRARRGQPLHREGVHGLRPRSSSS